MQKSTKTIKNFLKVFGGSKYLVITENEDFIQDLKSAEVPGMWRNKKPVDHDLEDNGVDVHLILK